MVFHMAVCQNLVPLVNIKIAGKWMFIPLKMVLIGIDPYTHISSMVTMNLELNREYLRCNVRGHTHLGHWDSYDSYEKLAASRSIALTLLDLSWVW